MEDILNSISSFENSINLVDNLIQNILIYELPDGELILNLGFHQSKEYNPKLIGGLAATIHEFAKSGENVGKRSINLEKINLVFTHYEQFLIVFVVDPNYPGEQFVDLIDSFVESFKNIIAVQDLGFTVDGAAVTVQILINLVSEEILIKYEMGPLVDLYAFKLNEAADKVTNRVLGIKEEEQALESEEAKEELPILDVDEPTSPQEKIQRMLKQFVFRFDDVTEITLIRTTLTGEFEKITESKLDDSTSDNIYENVMEMIDVVSNLLEEEIEHRTIDLGEDGQMLFQNVSDLAFLYIVITSEAAIDTLEPIIERVATSLKKLFPDDLVA